MLQFRALASSSAGCSYLVTCGLASLLIDAGLTFEVIRRATNFKLSSLDGCLVSHAHGDHCKAVPQLLAASVDVYASEPTWRSLGFFDERSNRWPSHRAKILHHREAIKVGPWTVQPFDAVHDADGTLGFLVGSPEGDRLLYLTDTAYSKFTFEGLTHIAVEANYSRELLRENAISGAINLRRGKRTTCTHLSLERLIEMLNANDLSKVQEIHLLHLSDQNSDEVEFKRAVQQATGKPVYVAAKAVPF